MITHWPPANGSTGGSRRGGPTSSLEVTALPAGASSRADDLQELRGPAARGLGGARRAELPEGRGRRHAVVPLVLPDGHLRLLRHDGQRRPALTCATFLTDYRPGPIRVEPLRNFPVIRDLVIELGDFMEKLPTVKPWIIRDEDAAAR